MTTTYRYIADPVAQLTEIPAESIVSRTLIAEPAMRVILFGFAAGQELTEHKTPMAASIQILDGEGQVTLGEDDVAVKAGDLIYMPPNLPHSVRANTPLKMILIMAKGTAN
jgi:quercetin dioxygenase-like cupin family protein